MSSPDNSGMAPAASAGGAENTDGVTPTDTPSPVRVEPDDDVTVEEAELGSTAENKDGTTETVEVDNNATEADSSTEPRSPIRDAVPTGDSGDATTGSNSIFGSGPLINDSTTESDTTMDESVPSSDDVTEAVAASGSGNVINDGTNETFKDKETKRKGTKRTRGQHDDDATEAVAASGSGNVINDGTTETFKDKGTKRREKKKKDACDTVFKYEIPQPRTVVPFGHSCEFAETAEQEKRLEKYKAKIETQRQTMGEIIRPYEDDLKSRREADKQKKYAIDRDIKEWCTESDNIQKTISKIRSSNRGSLLEYESEDLKSRKGKRELQVPPPKLTEVPNQPARRDEFLNNPPSLEKERAPKSFSPGDAKPARRCHGCYSESNNMNSVVCANNKTNESKPRATCRKRMCELCINDSNIMIPGGCSYDAAKSNPNWICTHCSGKCLVRASCSLAKIASADRALENRLKDDLAREIQNEKIRRAEAREKRKELDDAAFERYKKAVEMENERCMAEQEAEEKEWDEADKKIEEAREALKKKFEKDQK